MRRNKIICIFAMLLAATCSGKTAQQKDQWISLQNIHLQKGERVSRIDISMKAASFVAIPRLPMGWHVTIDNDPSQDTKLSGDIYVGSAALELNDLQRFKFRAHRMEYGDSRFNVSGKLSVTKDFQNEREIVLGPANFQMTDVAVK